MLRSALVVDDSRTALLALSRLLKARDIGTDTAESGPEALDLLRHNSKPDVIFLDHMMPGMDGFEVLAALKADIETAAIPVVMYTSKEGEAYIGQALALGAFGVLRKPIDPIELAYILQRVHQLRAPVPASSVTSGSPSRAAVTGVIPVPPEFRARPVVPRQVGDVQPDPKAGSFGNPVRAGRWERFMLYTLLGGMLLLPGFWYHSRYQQAEQWRQQTMDENRRLQEEAQDARTEAARLVSAQPAMAEEAELHRERRRQRALLDTVAWLLNQHGQYGLNEEPFSDTRLQLLRELVARLASAEFQGTIRLETHVGEFCLVRDEQGRQRLPDDDLPLSRCEQVTYPPALAEQRGLRQSPAFARYLAERRSSNPIQIVILSYGTRRPLQVYPDSIEGQTAGEWNQVARINQRIDIRLLPAP